MILRPLNEQIALTEIAVREVPNATHAVLNVALISCMIRASRKAPSREKIAAMASALCEDTDDDMMITCMTLAYIALDVQENDQEQRWGEMVEAVNAALTEFRIFVPGKGGVQ